MSTISIVGFLNKVNQYILNPLILLAFGLSLIYFAYGVIKFLSTDANDKSSARVEARNSIMWGIVGMVIMFSVYGIIGFLLSTFGISRGDGPGQINQTSWQFLQP